jgi:hypothetical protein
VVGYAWVALFVGGLGGQCLLTPASTPGLLPAEEGACDHHLEEEGGEEGHVVGAQEGITAAPHVEHRGRGASKVWIGAS